MGLLFQCIAHGVVSSTAIAAARRAGVLHISPAVLGAEQRKLVDAFLWVGDRGIDAFDRVRHRVQKRRLAAEHWRHMYDSQHQDWKDGQPWGRRWQCHTAEQADGPGGQSQRASPGGRDARKWHRRCRRHHGDDGSTTMHKEDDPGCAGEQPVASRGSEASQGSPTAEQVIASLEKATAGLDERERQDVIRRLRAALQ